MYWCFQLDKIARNVCCLDEVKKTTKFYQLTGAIYGRRINLDDNDKDSTEEMKETLKIRKNQSIPV